MIYRRILLLIIVGMSSVSSGMHDAPDSNNAQEWVLKIQNINGLYKLDVQHYNNNEQLEKEILRNPQAIVERNEQQKYERPIDAYIAESTSLFTECNETSCPILRNKYPKRRFDIEEAIVNNFKASCPNTNKRYAIADFACGGLMQTLTILLKLKAAGYKQLDVYLIDTIYSKLTTVCTNTGNYFDYDDLLKSSAQAYSPFELITTLFSNTENYDFMWEIAKFAHLRAFFPQEWKIYVCPEQEKLPKQRIFDYIYAIDFFDIAYSKTPGAVEKFIANYLKIGKRAISVKNGYVLYELASKIPSGILDAYIKYVTARDTALSTKFGFLREHIDPQIMQNVQNELQRAYCDYKNSYRAEPFAEAYVAEWLKMSYVLFS